MIRSVTGILTALLCLHCAPGSHVPAEPPPPAPRASLDHPLLGYEAHFLITWNGARIGDASESLHARGAGDLRFERRERITVRRGEALVHAETQLVIDTDAHLRARQVIIRQIASGTIRRGEARRDHRGDWVIIYADEPARTVAGTTVPAELVPFLLASASHAPGPRTTFDGPVMLAGYGFAIARLRMGTTGERTLLATLSTPGGTLRGHFFLGQSGAVVRVRSDDGSGALRVDAATAAQPFEPPEIVDSASVPVLLPSGSGTWTRMDRIDALIIEPIPPGRSLPPALPGQHIERLADGWQVHLDTGDQGAPPALLEEHADDALPDPDMTSLAARIIAQSNSATAREEAFALARAAAHLLEDDLGAPGVGARSALAQGRGDCTAHALLFAALTQARGIPTRLVTGYRIDYRDDIGDTRLVRHRWAVVAVDGVWIAVDPTHGEAPAAPRLIGLAVHGPRAAELALADDLAFAGLADIHVRACQPGSVSDRPCDRSMSRTR